MILVDLDNMEAASTAFVLLRLIRKKVIAGIQGSIPHVLMKLCRKQILIILAPFLIS